MNVPLGDPADTAAQEKSLDTFKSAPIEKKKKKKKIKKVAENE